MGDSTSDSTTIIIIDSTATDVENLQATVANSLVGDFAASMGPIAAKCDTLAGRMDNIKDTISGMSPSNTSLLDELLANALNAAYQSSAWAMAADASQRISDVLAKCDYFNDVADKLGKYANASKFIKSLASAAKEKAEQAIEGIADKFGGSSNFPELGIGKTLSDIISTGRTVYDKVEETLEDVAEAISPIIEHGKNAVNQVQTELAAAAKELAKLDKLINCLAALGGADYSDIVDGMIEELECYYDKLGVFSDPNFANFGEFDVDSYLYTIGTLSPESANNIKKSINLYNKSRKNAEGAMAKAADLGVKTPSALDPSNLSEPMAKKQEYINNSSKSSYTVPAIPGKTEEKVITIPEPEPVPQPPIVEGVPPVPVEKVPYTTYVKETEITIDPSFEAEYNLYDPEHAEFNKYLSAAYTGISDIEVDEKTPPPNIKLKGDIFFGQSETNSINPSLGDKNKYRLVVTVAVKVLLINTNTGLTTEEVSEQTISAGGWVSKEFIPFTDEYKKPAFLKATRLAFKGVKFNSSSVQPTLT